MVNSFSQKYSDNPRSAPLAGNLRIGADDLTAGQSVGFDINAVVATTLQDANVAAVPTVLANTTGLASLTSTVAGLAAAGGVIGENHTTTTVTNTVSSATLKSFAAQPTIGIAPGDTILGTFIGSAFNTSGADRTFQPILKFASSNIHQDDGTNYPMTMPSVASKTRSWAFQFELRVGDTSTTHRQSSMWLLTKAGGTSAVATSGTNLWAPMETNFPMFAMNVSSTSDIGTSMPFIELRVGFDTAVSTVSMSCHYAQINLIKKP